MKVEVIARRVGKSKSSFYHHFADLEVFTELLLAYHLERAKVIAEMERRCLNIDPDLIAVMVEVKEDLLFNRQLRVNRTEAAFKKCFEASNQLVEEALLEVWSREIGLADNTRLAGVMLALVMENFYLQLTEETLNREWLLNYFQGIRSMVGEFQKA